MKKSCYITITADFAATNDGYRSGCNVFKYATTKDGQIVCSANSLNEFPELFDGRSRVNTLFLSPSDFNEKTPTPPNE